MDLGVSLGNNGTISTLAFYGRGWQEVRKFKNVVSCVETMSLSWRGLPIYTSGSIKLEQDCGMCVLAKGFLGGSRDNWLIVLVFGCRCMGVRLRRDG